MVVGMVVGALLGWGCIKLIRRFFVTLRLVIASWGP